MKYLVTWAWEMDGHAGASAVVCETISAVRKYMEECLKDDEGKPMGKFTSSRMTDYGYEYFGEWECGQIALSIRKFKNYSDMKNKEVFARTG